MQAGSTMALGLRKSERQAEMWIAAGDLPRSRGHVFYQKLNELLAENGFDAWVEDLCRPHYADKGRPGIPPGVYFRMLLVGYFEGLGSQRGIAWRCADSLSLRAFLGLAPTEEAPDHSSLTVIRERLPLEVHAAVFQRVLALAGEKKLLEGQTLGVDSTTLEANAAMKSIVRRDNGENWEEYVKRLAAEDGVEIRSKAELIRYDKDRDKKGKKKVSNDEWVSPADSDARIAKMKDGTTHLAYKAEHVVDLESNLVLAAEIHEADRSDASTVADSVLTAEINVARAGGESRIEEVVADKGYHRLDMLAELKDEGYRTYIPEPEQVHDHVWIGKPEGQEEAYRGNRRRTRGVRSSRSKRLQKLRSEKVERTFAHVCETGGGRRS